MCDSFRISEFDGKKSSGMQHNHSQKHFENAVRESARLLSKQHFESESYGLSYQGVEMFWEWLCHIPLDFFPSKPQNMNTFKEKQREYTLLFNCFIFLEN